MPNTMGALFTVILEFAGTNSVSQLSALSPEQAFLEWQKGLETPVKYGLRPERAEMLAKALRNEWDEHIEDQRIHGRKEAFVRPLSELKNVWCVWLSVDNESALINIVDTRRE